MLPESFHARDFGMTMETFSTPGKEPVRLPATSAHSVFTRLRSGREAGRNHDVVAVHPPGVFRVVANGFEARSHHPCDKAAPSGTHWKPP